MKTYEEMWEVRTCDCDMFSAWRPAAIMRAMQDVASAHSDRLGVGIRDMNEQGIAWVISRGHVEMQSMPMCGDRISIQTYPLPARHLFRPRVHVFRNRQGQEIGHAYCLWVVIDKGTRKIIRSEFVDERMPVNRDLGNPTGPAQTVQELRGEHQKSSLEPVFTDCDFIGHVNNTRYLDWCYDAMGYAVLKDHYVSCFDINYDHEIRLGEKVENELNLQNGTFTFTGSAEGHRCFAIGGSLHSRNT